MEVPQIIIGVLGGAISIVAYSFMTFATKKELEQLKEEFKDLKSDMDKRLERIEIKLDRLIERER